MTAPAAVVLSAVRPLMELSSMVQLRAGFLYGAVPAMEKSRPEVEAAAEILSLYLAAGLFTIGAPLARTCGCLGDFSIRRFTDPRIVARC